MKKSYILFFDTPFIQISRFCAHISREIKEIDPDIRTAVVCLVASPKKLPLKRSDCPDIVSSSFDEVIMFDEVSDIDSFLTQQAPDYIVLAANRVIDQEIALHARRLNIRTFLMQHGVAAQGLNIDSMSPHNIMASTQYIDKVLHYFSVLKRMCKYNNQSFFGLLAKMIKGGAELSSIICKYLHYASRCDKVFVIGKYWEGYYRDYFGYQDGDFYLVGDHDLDDLKLTDTPEPAVCYIANTLVEEGTTSKKEFLSFIEYLAECISPDTKLYIKLHPQSDIELYKRLNNHNVEFINQAGYLPNTTVYIGHRSALIGKALYTSDQLIIWKFGYEKDDKGFYESYASAICSNKQQLEEALRKIDINQVSHDKLNLVQDMFFYNPNGAFSTCANIIVNALKGVET